MSAEQPTVRELRKLVRRKPVIIREHLGDPTTSGIERDVVADARRDLGLYINQYLINPHKKGTSAEVVIEGLEEVLRQAREDLVTGTDEVGVASNG